MSRTTRFNNPNFCDSNINKDDYGFFLLRTNYKRVKPYSKYIEEGERPRSPNLPYSYLSGELISKNPKNEDSIFKQTRNQEESIKDKKMEIERFYNERHTDTFNEHLIRGISSTQPYGFIRKEPHNNYGASGETIPKFRTRSHYVAEPVERYVNIDMYKRPLTNQKGKIIFDHGRPNNGYYLQRHQYDNTWFNSNLKLNQTDILKSVAPKTTAEYKSLDDINKALVRSKTVCWPFVSEYVEKFTLNSK